MALAQANSKSTVIPFGPVRQIQAGVLDVGYVDAGPADAPPSCCCTAGRTTSTAYAEVAPRLAAAGYRVIVPYLRGYGTTRFLSDGTVRNGEQAALALDAVALMDALEVETAVIAGFDWGARTRQHRRRAVARTRARLGIGERLSDRQPGSRQGAVAAGGRASVVVPVSTSRPSAGGRVRQIPVRVRQADLATGVSEVEFDDETFDRTPHLSTTRITSRS